jgi:tetratricopeptide (TPR) repeat protein
MRLDLSRVLEERSGDAKAALEVLEKALEDEPGDVDVLSEIERLAAMTDGWAGAAIALEVAIKSREDLASDVACELWLKSAGWRKDKANDVEGAEKALEAAFATDPDNASILRSIEEIQRSPGREKDLVDTLRKLARLETPAAGNELRKEAKGIAESALEDSDLAEAILREMIEADDGDRWAMSELALLREKAEDYQEVYDLLVRQAELSAQADLLSELRHRAAEVASEKLGDKKAAIALYEQLFEDTPRDEKASTALRALYAGEGMQSELLALLSRLTDLADEVGKRGELRLEAAAICDKLNADTEAIELLQAVLEEEKSHQEATLQLSRLYEKTGRDEDLAELLSSQIDLAKDREDVESELRYRVRLGEVQESRLGSTEKAIATFRAVLERDDAHKDALLSLARLHEQGGDKAESAKMLERVLAGASGEEAVATAIRLADMFSEVGDDEGVGRALEQGLKADQGHEELRDRLRSYYEKRGAWTEYAEMLTWDADHSEDDKEKVVLLRKAAHVHQVKRKDPSFAADLLVRASELAPDDRDLLLLLCDAYSASGRAKQSVEVLEKIVESYGGRRSKDLATIHHRLAKAHLADGDKVKGLEELEVAFKIDPGSVPVLRELGVLSLELAEAAAETKDREAYLDRAQKTFRALLLQRLDDSSPITKAEVFYYLGATSHKQGDDKKALQMLERALDNDKELEMAKSLLEKLKG